jgi:hypothetical protein
MKNITTLGAALACALATLFTASTAHAQFTTDVVSTATLTSSGYTQNFDTMGTGTVAPAGWTVVSEAGSHSTFAPVGSFTTGTFSSINFTAGTLTSEPTLTAGTPTTQKGLGGYNFDASGLTSVTGDRALGTSPSGNAGTYLGLTLTNNTGSAITNVSLAYDIDRFTTTADSNGDSTSSPNYGVEEFPGYQLFYTLNSGTTWTNVSSLNPTIDAGTAGAVQVPNTVGVTSVSDSNLTLSSAWASGSTIEFAWFDDNAESPSPDQLIGLDNVSVEAVPEPSAGVLGLVALGVAFTLVRLRRQRA